ncbi:MAG: YkgJ family cysteine cluster protein [Polyangiales bacterium]
MTVLARREPLLVRPGARFDCVGDGLCCSDIHAVGALSDDDCAMLSIISEDAIDRHEGEDAAVLMMRSDTGRCVFWSEQGCAIHSQLGPEMKPTPCIQFPYALTATPLGGRISTQHRCTCRTLGPLPPVSAEEARPCLLDVNGELKPEHAVLDEVAWSQIESLSFAEYAEREAGLISALLEGTNLMSVLDAQPFPSLDGMSWTEVADEMLDFHGTARAAFAARRFGDAIGFLVDRREPTEQGRPWADAFERAGERVTDPVSPNKVFGDWMADEIWSLRWTRFGSLARARVELATRLAIARRIAGWLDISSPKQDNISAAEAVMIVDVIGTTDPWEKVQEAIGEP